MKKYIQPESIEMTMQMESVIATSSLHLGEGTDATPLTNGSSWTDVDWSNANTDFE